MGSAIRASARGGEAPPSGGGRIARLSAFHCGQYWYRNPQRDAGNLSRVYDLDLMKSAVLQEGGPFTLFGGEPLLLPLADLEELWSWGLQQFGGTSLQTNGVLVTDAHIQLFKKYRVHVGISLDGHLLEVEDEEARQRLALSEAENVSALLAFAGLQTHLSSITFDVFAHILRMLMGNDIGSSCVWKACDSYTTQAVRGVEGLRQRSNCGRVVTSRSVWASAMQGTTIAHRGLRHTAGV